jgi:hypothetical protein
VSLPERERECEREPERLDPYATYQLIARAAREGVKLAAAPGGLLEWTAAAPPSEVLLALLKAHKADILALLVPPPSESAAIVRARQTIWQLQSFGFRASCKDDFLTIADDFQVSGKYPRDVSKFLPIGEVFDTLVAGLADDPHLLDP